MKHIKTLQSKKGRKERGEFLAEGVRLLEEAYRCRISPSVLYISEASLSERGRRLAAQFQKRGIRIETVSARQMAGLSETREPQGLLAVFSTPVIEPAQLSAAALRRVLLCEGIGDPGNVGTLLRSARAFGFTTVVLVDGCAEPFSPKVVRASAGAVFGLKIATAPLAETLAWLRERALPLLAADARGEDNPQRLRELAAGPLVLALGSEADGLSADIIEAGRLIYRVGHKAEVESLNVAVAGSILMKQVYDFS